MGMNNLFLMFGLLLIHFIIDTAEGQGERETASTGDRHKLWMSSLNDTKGIRDVIDQWVGFVQYVKNETKMKEQREGLRSVKSGQRRFFDGTYSNDGNQNNQQNAPEQHENKYYALQGYYARYGSAGTEKNKNIKASRRGLQEPAPVMEQSGSYTPVAAAVPEKDFEPPKADRPIF